MSSLQLYIPNLCQTDSDILIGPSLNVTVTSFPNLPGDRQSEKWLTKRKHTPFLEVLITSTFKFLESTELP